MECLVSSQTSTFKLCIIYRPPPSRKNKLRNSVFFDEWSTYLDEQATVTQELIITGDMNFHLDVSHDSDTRKFLSMLEGHGFQQHVKEPTHIHGHILDVFITRQISSILEDCPTVLDPCLCHLKGNPSGDHFAIKTSIRASKPQHKTKEVTFRRLKALSMQDLTSTIQSTTALHASYQTVDEQTDAYNSSIRGIIDRHAPCMTKTVKGRPAAPWYTDDIQEKKRARRKAERTWRKSGLEVHRLCRLPIS